ncbi:MAG: indolepyruvate ferredoxin oxidoreductase family protein [Rubrivivax sp.]|nr:indolepyruvate ferredoxin oxidoreductase family protein [Rubrivivax sp.]
MVAVPAELQDRWRVAEGRVWLTGVQALTRLPMLQRERDRAAGLNTAGFVSGYRGSPLAGLDATLHEAERYLAEHDVRFQPAVNEELAATAVWGTQQLGLFGPARRDGIFAMCYAKGPGIDRCVDVFKHANHAGTAPAGGVLVIAGDDHAARSSAVAHQSEHVFSACAMPVLAPSNVQEIIDYGLAGWALSRHAGLWVALKLAADVVESSAVVTLPVAAAWIAPADLALPPGGLHIRWPDPQAAQEHRMQAWKIYAALAWVRANGLNRVVIEPAPRQVPKLGLIACGKAWADLREAMVALGLGDEHAAALGLRVMKIAMPWPLEADAVRRFASGLPEILVVEEKRQIIEYQLKEMLYDWRDDVRPRVLGKFDEGGEWTLARAAPQAPWLLPPTGELSPLVVARALAQRLARLDPAGGWPERAAALMPPAAAAKLPLQRVPYFCPGCPHSRSTQVPEDSCALAGVGCHLMAVGMERRTLTISQMGGEGATWIGMAPHAGLRHVFANMGDGTYFHSGLLAIRAAVAAGVDITYKLLYNDAVAMTGGQPVDGPLTVPQLTRQLAAEGVARIVVIADDPAKYGRDARFADGVQVLGRERFDAVQHELREVRGTTVIVYDQLCATEARRRRRRGTLPAPPRQVVIHEELCEGCGDCSVKSNCLAVVPVATELGTKRAVDPFTCNADYSCLDGECPALVTVEGAVPRRGSGIAADEGDLPLPAPLPLPGPWSVLVAGVGGTGVVTIGALLGMAAHLEGLDATVLDQTGLAQKGGAVLTHVRFAPGPRAKRDSQERQESQASQASQALHAPQVPDVPDVPDVPQLPQLPQLPQAPQALHTPRIVHADVLLGCDLLVASGSDALARLRAGHTRAVVNTADTITGDIVRHPELGFPHEAALAALRRALGHDASAAADEFDATGLAAQQAGHSIAANVLLLGFAWQRGWLPLSRESIVRAIELNGAAVQDNLGAFAWGRRLAHAPQEVLQRAAALAPARAPAAAMPLAELVARRELALRASHGVAAADRYRALFDRVRDAEERVVPGSARLARVVAQVACRLHAPKDEFEAARRLTDPAFEASIAARFDGALRIHYHLAPPWQRGGRLRKADLGPWARPWLRLLAAVRWFRGSGLDPWRGSAERQLDRDLAARYEQALERVLGGLSKERLDSAVRIAELPAEVRGFGQVRARAAERLHVRLEEALRRYEAAVAGPPRDDLGEGLGDGIGRATDDGAGLEMRDNRRGGTHDAAVTA